MNGEWLLESAAWDLLKGLGGLLTPQVAVALSLASLMMLVASLVLTPLMLVKIPANYFLLDKPPLLTRLRESRPGYRWVILLKNLLGGICVVAGLLMLILPGQGLLTILAGVFLLDFHGKKELERKLVSRPRILKSVNWLRRRYGKPELEWDEPIGRQP